MGSQTAQGQRSAQGQVGRLPGWLAAGLAVRL